jgi:anti-sigma regulatory factor (Ser/Thr protein kinase)
MPDLSDIGWAHAGDGPPACRGPAVAASTWAPFPHSQPRGQTVTDGWPLRSYLELGALPGAVPCARLHARQVLWEWELPVFCENAELLVSELMTNAIQASPSAGQILPVCLWLSSDRSRLLIQVHDTNCHPPVCTRAGGGDENGRGLLIVDDICTEWGWHINQDDSGKMVWALIESRLPQVPVPAGCRDDLLKAPATTPAGRPARR